MKSLLKIIVLSITIFSFMIVGNASGIEKFYINAEIQSNGDLVVEEYFYLNGEFNGMEREILYKNDDLYDFRPELDYYGGSKIHNGSGIELNEIRALPIDDNFDFSNIDGTLFERVSSADAGDYGVYKIDTLSDGESYRIYLPDSYNEAFYIKYTLKNMAVVHEDVAEIYWNAIGDSLSESIGTLKIKVTFPGNQNEFRIWAHGPLNGEIYKSGVDTLEAEVNNVYSYEAVDVRAVFDTSVVSDSTKTTGVVALDKIINYETDAANQANYEREQEEYQNQQNAYEELEYCNEYVSRNCYNNAKYYISLVTDETVLEDLNKKLEELHVLVKEKEESDARYYTDLAIEYVEYYWYNNAMEAVSVLESTELKEELLKELEPVREKIIASEEDYNKNACFIALVVIASILGVGIYIYIKCDKEYKVNFDHQYLRDFPDKFSPSTVEYLFKKGISDKSISAEILYLIYQKKIKATEDKNKDDILLEKNIADVNTLSMKEKSLMTLLFNNSKKVWLKDLKKRASSSMSFYREWEKLHKYMLNEALNEQLYEDDNLETGAKSYSSTLRALFIVFILIIAAGIGFIAFFIAIIAMVIFKFNAKKLTYKTKDANSKNGKIKKWVYVFSVLVIIYGIIGIIHLYVVNHFVFDVIKIYPVVIILAIILMIYTSNARRKTMKGAEEYKKWQAFKRFLEDFGTFDEKTLPEIALWEKYLVYAVVLGCADKLSKTMKLKIENMDLNEDLLLDTYMISHLHTLSRAVNTSISSARSHAIRTTSSSSSGGFSSGSGGGGGFSSGGGFGGGGGGGGRF